MGKYVLLCFIFLSLTVRGADQDLPLPLPDDSYPEDPRPKPNPSPVPPPPVRKEVSYTLGSGTTDRFGSRTFEFYLRSDINKITRIRLVGVRNSLEIKEVLITYADNNWERRDLRLAGDLRAGGVRYGYYDGRPIYRMKVKVGASNFWKRPGSFRLEVTAQR